MSRGGCHPLRWAVLAWALPALPARPASAPDRGEVTMMDPVFVEASAGNPWRYIAGPGFEIISRCPEAFNEAYARSLQREAAARLALLPAGFWGQLASPIKIVLYNRPPEPGQGVGASSPIDLAWEPGDGALLDSGSLEFAHPVTVGDGDTFINCGNYWNTQSETGDLSVDPGSALLLENRVPRFPAWFIAGLVGPRGLYVNHVVRSGPLGDSLVLPNAVWVSYAETVAMQDEARRKDGAGAPRRRPALLALDELLRGSASGDERETWNAEAALFVRWGLFASGQRQAFLDFVDATTREPASEALFREHLGMGFDAAARGLEGYLPAAVSEAISVPIDAAQPDVPEVRDAMSSEVARIIGDWGRMEGRDLGPQYAEFRRQCLDQADQQFERAIARRANDPLFLAAYGLYRLQAGEETKAFEALDAATRAGVVRPRAYVELARLRLERALPAVQQGIGDLGEPEFEGILGLLTTARLQMPALVGTYHVLAQTLEHAPRIPAPEDMAALDTALRLFPRDARLAYRVATLYQRLGDPAKASSVIARASAFADSAQARALLASFPAARSLPAR